MRRLRVLLASVGLIGLAACGDLSADLESAKNEVADIGREALEAAGASIDTRTACALAGQSEAFCGCLSERLGPEITPERIEAFTEAVRASVTGERTSGESDPAGADDATRQAVVQCATRAAIDGAVNEGVN